MKLDGFLKVGYQLSVVPHPKHKCKSSENDKISSLSCPLFLFPFSFPFLLLAISTIGIISACPAVIVFK